MSKPLSQIETPTESYVTRYQSAVDAAVSQMAIFWPAEELGVEEDLGDFLTKLSIGEQEGVLTLQRVLTQYELMIGGDEMWGGRIQRLFPRPEIQRACSVFAMVELNSHAPFYDLINKTLSKNTDEFYSEWRKDPDLSKHIAWMGKQAEEGDALEATAALAFFEGVMLFSAFAFFKSFKSRGFNMIPHFVSGIDGSAKDENFHSLFSAGLFRQCRAERTEIGNHTEKQANALDKKIIRMATDVYNHEIDMIKRIFAKHPETIRTVTMEEMEHFCRDRVNIVLDRLGYAPMFVQETGVISGWFYKSLNTYKHSDFFASTQLQYRRDWKKHLLVFDLNQINVEKAEGIGSYLKAGV